MQRVAYPTDLTDEQWEFFQRNERFMHGYAPGDAQDKLREIINAWMYRWATGCEWKMLPHDFPTYRTCMKHHRRWRADMRLSLLRIYMLDYEKFPRSNEQRKHIRAMPIEAVRPTKPR